MPIRPADAHAAGTVVLRQTDRRDLLRALGRLSSADPAERAKAASRASELMRKRRATWDGVLVPAAADVAGPAPTAAPAPWPAAALVLLERPDLSEGDREALRRVSAWKAPGQAGLALVREVEGRVRNVAVKRGRLHPPA